MVSVRLERPLTKSKMVAIIDVNFEDCKNREEQEERIVDFVEKEFGQNWFLIAYRVSEKN